MSRFHAAVKHPSLTRKLGSLSGVLFLNSALGATINTGITLSALVFAGNQVDCDVLDLV